MALTHAQTATLKAIRVYEDGVSVGGYVGEVPGDFNLHLSYGRWVSIPNGWFSINAAKKISASIFEIEDKE